RLALTAPAPFSISNASQPRLSSTQSLRSHPTNWSESSVLNNPRTRRSSGIRMKCLKASREAKACTLLPIGMLSPMSCFLPDIHSTEGPDDARFVSASRMLLDYSHNMTLKDTMKQLESLGNEKMRAHNTKYGAGKNQFGVSMGDIRK